MTQILRNFYLFFFFVFGCFAYNNINSVWLTYILRFTIGYREQVTERMKITTLRLYIHTFKKCARKIYIMSEHFLRFMFLLCKLGCLKRHFKKKRAVDVFGESIQHIRQWRRIFIIINILCHFWRQSHHTYATTFIVADYSVIRKILTNAYSKTTDNKDYYCELQTTAH